MSDLDVAPHRERLSGPPRRRLVAWVVAALVLVGAVWLVARPDGAFTAAVAGAVVVIGATTLTTYVPVQGRRLDLGCTPCAVVAGFSVPLALVLLASGMAGFAVLVTGAGLVQRLRRPDTCPTPAV